MRDRIVFGVKEPALRKKLLQEGQLTLEKAIDICKSGETTAQHLRDLATATDSNEVNALKLRDDEKRNCRKTREIQRMPKDANTVEEITGSRGKNVRRMERLAESAERVITLLESVSSVDERKNGSTQSRSDSGESLFTVQSFKNPD